MDLYVLNTNFERIAIIDSYESIIWTDRYREAGDFELYCFPEKKVIETCQADYYLENTESEHLMIIEGRKVTTDVDDGDRFVVTGQSLVSILKRRVIWKDIKKNGPVQTVVEKLLNDAIIAPELADRKIPNFEFVHNNDPIVEGISITKEFKMGDDLYEMVKTICEENGLGFKITLSDAKKFQFMLYSGDDRSYDQKDNPYVVFSPEFDNVITSEYSYSKEDYKNICLIEATDKNSEQQSTYAGECEGLMRREMFIDGSDVPNEDDNGNSYSSKEFIALMVNRAKKELISYEPKEVFEGEVDASRIFVYGKDFFLGDILQVANAYGMEGPSLVTEIIWSHDDSGYSCYPTFEAKNNGEDDTLFYNGNQYRAVTGGWGVYDTHAANYELSMSTTILMKSGKDWNHKSAWCMTNNMIDMTPYSKIRFDIVGYGKVYIAKARESNPDKRDPIKTVNVSITAAGVAEIDVSDVNQECYVAFGPWGPPNYVEVYKVALIK